MKNLILIFSAILVTNCAHISKKGSTSSSTTAADAIHSMAGCYLVDYNYVESVGIKPGYQRDTRVYDVNNDKAVKEWIYAEDLSPSRIRLQHILFSADQNGKVVAGSELKHQAEDWEYEPPHMYNYLGGAKWKTTPVAKSSGNWVRRITSLDDGLRYQCAAPWNLNNHYPEWTCTNYAPIPGRETRDMGRKDYQGLNRTTRIVAYGNSWLERQENTKTIEKGEQHIPLAKEVGKNWYVRLPDNECSATKDFVKARKEFWSVLRETWNEVFKDGKPITEKDIKPPRYAKMFEIEDTFIKQNLSDPNVRKQAKDAILKVIREYLVN